MHIITGDDPLTPEGRAIVDILAELIEHGLTERGIAYNWVDPEDWAEVVDRETMPQKKFVVPCQPAAMNQALRCEFSQINGGSDEDYVSCLLKPIENTIGDNRNNILVHVSLQVKFMGVHIVDGVECDSYLLDFCYGI